MRLSELIAALPSGTEVKRLSGADEDPIVRGITYDSRKVVPGDLFVAFDGSAADGHDYLAAAIELGAVALLVESEAKTQAVLAAGGHDLPVVQLGDSRRAMAPLSTHFFGEPASELSLIGITGTNGKTSTSYLCESILAQAGVATGLIGTVEVRYADETLRAVNTTPESLDLQRLLRAMRTQEIEAVVMEVSSHGLALGRVNGCNFRVAAITNVTQDHLDFHGSMEAYLASKLQLFELHLAEGGVAVINVDDPSSAASLAAAERGGARILRVSRRPDANAEVVLEHSRVELSGSQATVRMPEGTLELELPLLGDFNLENLVVACGIAAGLELPADAIRAGVARCPQVPGRMELVSQENSSEPTVVVDYAHTPDAVDKLLAALRPLTPGRLITVFGCGGDRDRAKRPLMAAAVARWSDRIVATSDNPRTEDPEQILRDVEPGLRGLTRVEADALVDSEGAYLLEIDRRLAIEQAVAIAGPEDTVVLAGKGHEDYQILGHEKFPFDDRQEAARALAHWRSQQ